MVKDQAERSEDIPKSGKQRKSVPELRLGAKSTPETLSIPIINKCFFVFQIDDNSGPASQEEDQNFPQTFPPGGENFILKI